MRKTIFIIPGFQESISQKQYRWMKPFFTKKGFKVKSYTPKWKYKVMSDYAVGFEEYYELHKTDKNYVLGFSFGAMIAFITATTLRPNKLLLCSLSPYFSEDLATLEPSWEKFIGKRRLKDFRKFKARKIAQNLKAPTIIFLGEVEARFPQMKKRYTEIKKYAKQVKQILVKNAPHEIDYPEYVTAIKKEFA